MRLGAQNSDIQKKSMSASTHGVVSGAPTLSNKGSGDFAGTSKGSAIV